MTNLEMLRTSLSHSQRAGAMLEDLATATKLVEAAVRMSDRERAAQYLSIAGTTCAEVIEAIAQTHITEQERLEVTRAASMLARRLSESNR